MRVPSALRRWLPWIPALLYMSLIWWLSSSPSPYLPEPLFQLSDKILHTCEYAALGALLAHGLRASFPAWSRTRVFWVACLLTSAWGASDELHQAFVPRRSPDILDFCADTLGGLSGAFLRLWLGAYFGRKRRP